MNHLKNETSPYLLQHAENPVDWYPWSKEAFEKAKAENKPVFLSIGYSTCHWCHVMAHESFENKEIADILNEHFISIKVDKEERPDIDSIYMRVCQVLTGSGGWPTSIFLTGEQKPFYAGTYFPPKSRAGMIGFKDLLLGVVESWERKREQLLENSEEIIRAIYVEPNEKKTISEDIIEVAVASYHQMFDKKYGGFGRAPKFPTPHNLLFLLKYYEMKQNDNVLYMVEKTLEQLYRGGIFDHIGYGFSRYSTDPYFLVPHFEKMLYDNALLMMAYTECYKITKNSFYKDVAEKTGDFILREMTSPEGGFYSAQDADSDGVEGKYYVFSYEEIIDVLGKKQGKKFCSNYDITKQGNFEGYNIPNLLNGNHADGFQDSLKHLYEYRKNRTHLHLDDKILTSWNSLMIWAMAEAGRAFGNDRFIEAAQKACRFIEENLVSENTLLVSYRNSPGSQEGFLDDYGYYIMALIKLYVVTLKGEYLERAISLTEQTILKFYDEEQGGFYLYAKDSETLIIRPKETYDGALPSGNSVMSYVLVILSNLSRYSFLQIKAQEQLQYMYTQAEDGPFNYSFYLLALCLSLIPSKKVVCVLKDEKELEAIHGMKTEEIYINVLLQETDDYKYINNKTTFYVCKDFKCFPPTNSLMEAFQ